MFPNNCKTVMALSNATVILFDVSPYYGPDLCTPNGLLL